MRARLAVILTPLLLAGASLRAADGLAVDPKDQRFIGRWDLVNRISATSHGYFRFINTAFAAETCRLFVDVVEQMPEVTLHGDAHIEQYTVTNLGRGLSDFDDCTRGKVISRWSPARCVPAHAAAWRAVRRAQSTSWWRVP